MNICNVTSNNFNLDCNGKDMQIEVYEQLIKQLQQENKQLKDNWAELKEWASNFYNSEEVGWAGCGIRYTLEKMQELEGSDSNEI